ncbi:MAG: GxxExxY protein [Bacteroidetes bacterium]|nr:GxxExxY protein [Bacteroidota bacterium]
MRSREQLLFSFTQRNNEYKVNKEELERENELAKITLDICFKIHKLYGPGLFESVYEEIFCFELSKTKLHFEKQKPIPVIHETIKLEAGFRADVIVENKLLIELKSVEKLAEVHYKQVQTYLRLADIKLGLLVNFNVSLLKDGIKRIIYTY